MTDPTDLVCIPLPKFQTGGHGQPVRSTLVDLTGNRFGRLTVIGLSAKPLGKHGYHWVCQCECGALRAIMRHSLKNGAAVSCGCLKREVARTNGRHRMAEDITGQKFGHWTAISYAGKSGWNCRCDCGAERVIYVGALRRGDTDECVQCHRDRIKPNRPPRIEGEIAIIPLTRGKEAIIDAADLHLVQGYTWIADRTDDSDRFYAARWTKINGKRCNIRMHNVIVGALRVDHRDRDGLNNRRENLRRYEGGQNHMNARTPITNTSGFKGVSLTRNKRWTARIGINKKSLHLGNFDNPLDAARAYDAAAREHFGEFARLNFPHDGASL